jgi:hypothetical protein
VHSIERQLATFEIKTPLPDSKQTLQTQLHQVCGVDLTKIPGIKEQTAQIIISEVGLDMTRWNTEKQFSSFLGLCPNNLITGGKIIRRSTRKVYNRAADALRLCAQSLTHSKSAMGAKYRRLRARLGAPKAIVALGSSVIAQCHRNAEAKQVSSNRFSVPLPAVVLALFQVAAAAQGSEGEIHIQPPIQSVNRAVSVSTSLSASTALIREKVDLVLVPVTLTDGSESFGNWSQPNEFSTVRE